MNFFARGKQRTAKKNKYQQQPQQQQGKEFSKRTIGLLNGTLEYKTEEQT